MSNTEAVHSDKSQIKSGSSSRFLRLGQVGSVEPRNISRADESDGSPTDEELTAVSRDGDLEAFGQLIERHRGMCMRRALLILHDRGDAEDAVQVACGKAFQYLEQYHGNGTFAGWLVRIVENECLMRIRGEKQARFVYLDNRTESNIRLELVSQTSNPEDKLGREEVLELLYNEMLRMPPLYRNIMLLHDSEELPMPEVAGRLGLTIPAAKSRLQRARRELRLRLVKHCGPKGLATLLEESSSKQTAYARAA
jgi:RNA polymerase sigma-70 factor (ECF subfamily)